jgi:hypothetical protein
MVIFRIACLSLPPQKTVSVFEDDATRRSTPKLVSFVTQLSLSVKSKKHGPWNLPTPSKNNPPAAGEFFVDYIN